MTTRLLLIKNMIGIMPITLYLIFWGLVTLSQLNLFVFFLAFLIFMLVFAIFSAVRLKISIMRDTRDHRLRPVKSIYKKASRTNIYGYLIFYPMMLITMSGSDSVIGGLLLLGACILAIPLLVRILKLKKEYEHLKAQMAIGKIRCKNCKVSLFYHPQYKQWVCYKCGVRY
ncbi:MAG: hypothetical protein KAS16_09185 [Thermoplasmata archaeon]|nr:hypothetical protein [Thermoplasmata archaeon]